MKTKIISMLLVNFICLAMFPSVAFAREMPKTHDLSTTVSDEYISGPLEINLLDKTGPYPYWQDIEEINNNVENVSESVIEPLWPILIKCQNCNNTLEFFVRNEEAVFYVIDTNPFKRISLKQFLIENNIEGNWIDGLRYYCFDCNKSNK